MSDQNIYEDRIKLFKDTIELKKTERVPNLSNFFTWKILDSPYKLSEAMNDYNKMEKVVCDFHERYQFDAYMDLGTRNPIRVTDALGGGDHEVNDKTESINYYDHVLMKSDEYQELLDNEVKFLWTKVFARKFPDTTPEKLIDAVQELIVYGQFNDKMTDKFVQEYHCPSVFNMNAVLMHPFEYLHNNYRGIKEVSIDLRKRRAELKDVIDKKFETQMLPALDAALDLDTSAYVCDTYFPMLAHAILSPKQFEDIYWPQLKRIIDRVVEKNKTIYIFCESTMLRFKDYFQDIPKGHVILHLEQDDIFEIHKELPNICLAGGMTTDLLGNGTPRQCIDYSKKLIDELGNGFIFSQNKMVSFRNDCTRENLLAVNEFIRNY